MNTLRKTFIASALTCAVSWLLKMLAILATGGAESEALIVDVLWSTGMVTFLLAAGTGVPLPLSRAPVRARVLAGAVAVPFSFVLLNLLDLAVKSTYQVDGWFYEELSLVIAAVALGAVGLRVASTNRRNSGSEPARMNQG